MHVSPSSQDGTTIKEWVDQSTDKWYIMMIVNKRHDITLRYKDLYMECDMEIEVDFGDEQEVEASIKRIGEMQPVYQSTYPTYPTSTSNTAYRRVGDYNKAEAGKDSAYSNQWNGSKSSAMGEGGKNTKNTALKSLEEIKKENSKVYKKILREVIDFDCGGIDYGMKNILDEDDSATFYKKFNTLYDKWVADTKDINEEIEFVSATEPSTAYELKKCLVSRETFVKDTHTTLYDWIYDHPSAGDVNIPTIVEINSSASTKYLDNINNPI